MNVYEERVDRYGFRKYFEPGRRLIMTKYIASLTPLNSHFSDLTLTGLFVSQCRNHTSRRIILDGD